MAANCTTITPLNKIAQCLIKQECRSRPRGSCSAARYLIALLQEAMPQPFPCSISGRETSCTLCLSRILSGKCRDYDFCGARFYRGLLRVAKEGKKAFEFIDHEVNFTVISDNSLGKGNGGGESTDKIKVKTLVVWKETAEEKANRERAIQEIDKQKDQQRAKKYQSPSNSANIKKTKGEIGKDCYCSVKLKGQVTSGRLKVIGQDDLKLEIKGYIEDNGGHLLCEQCGQQGRRLFVQPEGGRICPTCFVKNRHALSGVVP